MYLYVVREHVRNSGGFGQGQVADTFEHVSVISIYMKVGQFLEYASNYQLLSGFRFIDFVTIILTL